MFMPSMQSICKHVHHAPLFNEGRHSVKATLDGFVDLPNANLHLEPRLSWLL
jgi:hypothetical protein